MLEILTSYASMIALCMYVCMYVWDAYASFGAIKKKIQRGGRLLFKQSPFIISFERRYLGGGLIE